VYYNWGDDKKNLKGSDEWETFKKQKDWNKSDEPRRHLLKRIFYSERINNKFDLTEAESEEEIKDFQKYC
jgi:hypothetical protein